MDRILEDDETKWIGLRETLRQSQSLSVAGQFAATVMHEINNPLEAISNLNYLLQGDAHNPELVLRYSQQIDEQLAVLTRIARQSLSFYRPAAEKSPVTAAALAEAALRIHRKSIAAKRIHIDIRLANDVTMDVHPGEMFQSSRISFQMRWMRCPSRALSISGTPLVPRRFPSRRGCWSWHTRFNCPEDIRSLLHHQAGQGNRPGARDFKSDR